jgi:NitT/TauT family transport system substrate-binding protein
MQQTIPKLLGSIMLCILVFFPLQRGWGASLEKIRLGEVRALPYLPTYVALAKGFFQEEGIEVELVTFPGGAKTREALMAGDITFASTATINTLLARVKGQPIKIIAAENVFEIFSLAVRAGLRGHITQMNQLKGLKVGVSSPGSGSWAWLVAFARKAGLDPDQDLQIIGVGGLQTIYTSLRAERIDVAVVWEPLTAQLLLDDTAALLIDIADPGQHRQWVGELALSQVLATREEVITRQPALVRSTIAAFQKAIAYIHTQQAKEIATVIAPYFAEMEESLLIKALERVLPGVPKDAGISEKAYNTDAQAYVAVGILDRMIPYDEIVDWSFAGRRP